MKSDAENYEIRQIEPGDKLTGLSLGAPEFVALKTFASKKARKYHEKDLAKTYGVFGSGDPNKIVAYITLVCGQVEAGNENGPSVEDEMEFGYDHFPAIKIARLAVDKRCSGSGIGKNLVQFAIGIAKENICPNVGCRFVVVDAKYSAVKFYSEKCGFTFLDTDDNRSRNSPILFIDLHKASK